MMSSAGVIGVISLLIATGCEAAPIGDEIVTLQAGGGPQGEADRPDSPTIPRPPRRSRLIMCAGELFRAPMKLRAGHGWATEAVLGSGSEAQPVVERSKEEKSENDKLPSSPKELKALNDKLVSDIKQTDLKGLNSKSVKAKLTVEEAFKALQNARDEKELKTHEALEEYMKKALSGKIGLAQCLHSFSDLHIAQMSQAKIARFLNGVNGDPAKPALLSSKMPLCPLPVPEGLWRCQRVEGARH